MPSILITGANRGLGLEFTRQYLQQGWSVIACCRQPEQANELKLLANNKLHIYQLDVTNFEQIDALAHEFTGQPIEIVLSNAGIYGDTQDDSFGQLNYQNWQATLHINTMAPVKLAEALLPNLQLAKQAKLIAITSQMASISDNKSGGNILYRSSKAALNAAMKSLAIDLKSANIAVGILHPGWVKTDMGGENALIYPEQSIAGMRQVIEQLNLNNSGTFYNYRGEILPW